MPNLYLYPYDSPFMKNGYKLMGNISFAYVFTNEEVENSGLDEILKHVADSLSYEITNATVQIHLRTYEEETRNA